MPEGENGKMRWPGFCPLEANIFMLACSLVHARFILFVIYDIQPLGQGPARPGSPGRGLKDKKRIF